VTSSESSATLESVLQRLLASWVVLVVFGVGGAVAGLGYSALHPPRYEARAVLGVSISYAITESLELIVEDRVLSRASGVILSDDVLARVLDELPDFVRLEQGWQHPSDLRSSLRIDHRQAQWELVTVSEDPVLAATVSQLWANAALHALDVAAAHAWRVSTLVGQILYLECVPVVKVENTASSTVWDCTVLPPITDPDMIEAELINETALSRGIVPDLTHELLQEAAPPAQPVLWARGPLVLAGTLAGVLVGVGFGLLPSRRMKANAPGR
jgi:hypothetical protein